MTDIAIIAEPKTNLSRTYTICSAILALVIGNLTAVIFCQQWLNIDVVHSTDMLRSATVFSLVTITATVLQVLILAAAVQIKGWSFVEYIRLALPNNKTIIVSLIGLYIFVAAMESAIYFSGGDLVSPFQVDLYQSAKSLGILPALLFAIVILGPIAEEVMFRGVLYRSLVTKSGQEIDAILITSLAWAMLHMQYDALGLLQVFVMGLFLGAMRWKTGSVGLTIIMHMLINSHAMAETFIKVDGQTLLNMVWR